MKVYLVYQDDKFNPHTEVIKVLSTEEKAKEYIDKMDDDNYYFYFEEMEVE